MMNVPADNRPLQRVLERFMYGTIIVFPFSALVKVFETQNEVMKLKVPLFDAVLWITLLIWICRFIIRRDVSNIQLPPRAAVAFVAAGAATLFAVSISRASLKELLQLFDYLLLFPFLFLNVITTRDRLRRAIVAAAAAAAVVVAFGFVQLVLLRGKTYLVSSTFDDRNVLTGYLAVCIPFFFGYYRSGMGTLVKSLIIFVGIGGIMLMTAVFPFIVFVCVMAVLCHAKYGTIRVTAALVFVLGIIAVSPVSVSRDELFHPGGMFLESPDRDGYDTKVRRSVEMMYFDSIGKIDLSGYTLYFFSSSTVPRAIPEEYTNYQFNARRKAVSFGESRHLDQRFIEWRAALNILADSPVFGVGLGRYQQEIGRYYTRLPKLNSMEPDAQNGYCVTLFTMGLTGLCCFTWLLLSMHRRIHAAGAAHACEFDRAVYFALNGGFWSLLFVNFFVPVLYQSTAVVFSFLLSVSISMASIMNRSGGKD